MRNEYSDMKMTSPKAILVINIPIIVPLRNSNSYWFACSLPTHFPANEDLESESTSEIMQTLVRDFVNAAAQRTF